MPSPETIFFSLTGGILPALLWLWFWLHEDRLHPEPRERIIKTFFAGMLAVFFAFFIEQKIQNSFSNNASLQYFLWACTEEILKWLAAYWIAFKSRDYDEPMDAVIYMITAALGFSALENSLFLISSLTQFNLLTFLATGNMRYIGATLLHVLSSGVLGLLIGFSFWKNKFVKTTYLVVGIIISTLLHTSFNLYIMENKGNGIFLIFSFVWLAIILLITSMEKLKRLKRKK